MLHFAVINSIIKAFDASIKVFISDLRMSFRYLCMFSDSLSISSFNRSFSVIKRFSYVALLSISAK
jgi:hypothetical protein